MASDFDEIVAGLINPTPLPRSWRADSADRRFEPRAGDRQPSSTEP